MRTLQEIYQNHSYPDGSGDKGTAHTYIEVYQDILEKYRYDTSAALLEIGIAMGYSVRMWGEYFSGTVAAVDITLDYAPDLLSNDRFKIFQCDATTQEFLHKLNGMRFDVIIDDGEHILDQQIASFRLLKHTMKPGGVYIIEDIVNIDTARPTFESLHSNCRIVDNRHIKGRYDDVLAIYEF